MSNCMDIWSGPVASCMYRKKHIIIGSLGPSGFPFRVIYLGNPQTYPIEKVGGKSWVWKGYSHFDFLPAKGKTRLHLIPFNFPSPVAEEYAGLLNS